MKDHLERKTLKLGRLKFRVLDECDEMLNMGFVSGPWRPLALGPWRPLALGLGLW